MIVMQMMMMMMIFLFVFPYFLFCFYCSKVIIYGYNGYHNNDDVDNNYDYNNDNDDDIDDFSTFFFIVIVLSHGNEGIIYGYDRHYQAQKVFIYIFWQTTFQEGFFLIYLTSETIPFPFLLFSSSNYFHQTTVRKFAKKTLYSQHKFLSPFQVHSFPEQFWGGVKVNPIITNLILVDFDGHNEKIT